MSTIVDAAKSLLNPRSRCVKQLADLTAKHERDGAARATALAAARKRRDEWERPQRELEGLELEHFNAGQREAQAQGGLEMELRQNQPPMLVGFRRWVVRAREALHYGRPVAHVTHNALTDETRVVNLDELERWDRGIAAVVEAEVALRDTLWKLPDAELRQEIAKHRQRIEADFDPDDMAETEPRPGRLGGRGL